MKHDRKTTPAAPPAPYTIDQEFHRVLPAGDQRILEALERLSQQLGYLITQRAVDTKPPPP